MWPFKKDKKLIQEQKKVAKLERELKKAKQKEADRENITLNKNKMQALEHLRVAERYSEQIGLAQGSRKTELQSLVDTRLEKAKNLGFDLDGTITETINGLV
ncbi:hypothetical protein [Pseudoalteromonas marina]|uniref:hypothetical protein n=1 Tax=Pseudoalteromonas marina TaxID=267375 RepID=UPI003C6AC9DE